jgi:hypothetical protein
MEEEIIYDEETQTVTVIHLDILDPNGNPLMVVYSYEEWDNISNDDHSPT